MKISVHIVSAICHSQAIMTYHNHYFSSSADLDINMIHKKKFAQTNPDSSFLFVAYIWHFQLYLMLLDEETQWANMMNDNV